MNITETQREILFQNYMDKWREKESATRIAIEAVRSGSKDAEYLCLIAGFSYNTGVVEMKRLDMNMCGSRQ